MFFMLKMVRVYTRTTTRQSWDENNMLYAIKAVYNEEMTYTKASTLYNVPRSTLQDRIKKLKNGKIELNKCASKGNYIYKYIYVLIH